MNLQVPQIDGNTQNIELQSNTALFVVGRNGSGKSSLMAYLSTTLPYSVYIPAHRIIASTPRNIGYGTNTRISEFEAKSRNLDYSFSNGGENFLRQGLDNLINLSFTDSINLRREVRKYGTVSSVESPIDKINAFLSALNLNVKLEEVEAKEASSIQLSKNGVGYSPARASDGERSILSIVLHILPSNANTFLIDEIDRHLYPGVYRRLLSELVKIKPNCTFVISTHDLGWVSSLPQFPVLIVNDSQFDDSSNTTRYWNTIYFKDGEDFPLYVRERKLQPDTKFMYVEGTGSGDAEIYQALYPEYVVKSMGSKRDVIDIIKNLNELTTDIGFYPPVGIVDKDLENNDNLPEKVYTTTTYSLEGILYSKDSITALIKHLGMEKPINSKDIIQKAIDKLKRPELKQLLKSKSEETNGFESYDEKQFDEDMQKNDWTSICQYPIHKTNIPDIILGELGWTKGDKGKSRYINTLVTIIRKNPNLRSKLREYISQNEYIE